MDLSNFATKKELNYAKGVNTSNLVAKRDLATLKTEIDKLDIDKLVDVPTGSNNFKTKIGYWDDDRLKKFSWK